MAHCSHGEGVRLSETAEQLQTLPDLTAALRRGELDPSSAHLVASAAASAPEREHELVQLARSGSFSDLKRACAKEVASREGEDDKLTRERTIHENRYLRTWTGRDGSGKGEFSLSPADFARLLASLEKETDELIEEAAKRSDEEITLANLRADALIALAGRPKGEGGGARPVFVLRVDLDALKRGATRSGETCEIQGVGEVSVTTARSLLGEATLKLVVRKGRDPRSITNLGRYVGQSMTTALWERDGGCVVCRTTRHIERDHWRVDFVDCGKTELANLCLLCKSCHRMKTHRGWRLEGGPGRWRWLPPLDDFDSEGDGPLEGFRPRPEAIPA